MSFLIHFSDDPHRVAEYLAAALNEWPKMRKRNGYSLRPRSKPLSNRSQPPRCAQRRKRARTGKNVQKRIRIRYPPNPKPTLTTTCLPSIKREGTWM